MSTINPALYEAAKMDGSNRLQMMLHITIPAILPTIVILLILDLSSLFSANFDQIYNLYNNYVLSTGDVLSTYIYRISLGGGTSFELSTCTFFSWTCAADFPSRTLAGSWLLRYRLAT